MRDTRQTDYKAILDSLLEIVLLLRVSSTMTCIAQLIKLV